MCLKEKKFLLILLVLLGSFSFQSLHAQSVSSLSDEQITKFIQQAQASGLSEAQIEELAVSRGFSQSDIQTMRDRIANLKKGNKTDKPLSTKRIQNGLMSGKLDSTETDSLNLDADLLGSQVLDKSKLKESKKGPEIYGMKIFQNKRLSFEPNLRLPTPRNYVLGTEDEINVIVSGYASQNYSLKISPEGTVKFENLSPIFVSGLSIEQAKERIVNRLKAIIPGLSNGNSSVDVTLGNVRSIKVMVIGEVKNPGTYTVSSLATAFNALYACGGPSVNGSLRNIEVYRNGKIIRKIDVYNFLLRGDQSDNIALFDQDVIRVPFYETHVELTGMVKSPMIFEAKAGDTFKNVLNFAGGFADSAYTKSVNVVRVTPIERKMISVFQEEYNTFSPKNGDKFVIGKILNRYENRVTIDGAVFRPGDYELEKDMTLSSLVKKAEGLREDAFIERILIKRLRENLDPEMLTVDLKKILRNEAPDISLNREDIVFVKSYSDLREKRFVSIMGAVNKAGNFDYVDSLNVGDLIVLAGGFTDGASATKIEIARRIKGINDDPKSGKTIQKIEIAINRDLSLCEADRKLVLQPFDKLFVRQLPLYEDQKIATISGEVVYPGIYPIADKTERITDLIFRAGGLKNQADLQSARFTHNKKVLSVDLAEIIKNPKSENNLLLYPNDNLEIPRKFETITVSGQVMNPITMSYQPKLSFRDYLDNAGGFTDSARVKRIFVRYANGSIAKTKRFFFVPIYPKIQSGMEIIVPTRKRNKAMTMAETISLITGFSAVTTSLVILFNYLKK